MGHEQDEIKKLALAKMQALCSKSEKCSKDIRSKLSTYNLDSDQVDDIIQSLTNDKFIDDQRFANFFTRDKFKFNQWGKRKIRQSLFQKGISEDIINSSLEQIDDQEYHDLLLKLLQGKNKSIKDQNHYTRKGKLFRFAAQKGFETEMIYEVIEDLGERD